MASDLCGLDLLVIQIDGIHMDDDLILVAALGVDAKGDEHPLGLTEGATENAATVQALIDNLVERGLDPTVPRLFIIDGAKALTKAIMERLPKSLHASVRRVLRQAWELDDADKRLKSCSATLPNVSNRDWSGVSGSILEGIDEILTVTRLRLPKELRRSLACTNIIENVMRHGAAGLPGTMKRWRSASMAMRWTAAAMEEAAKGFRRLKAHKHFRLASSDRRLGLRPRKFVPSRPQWMRGFGRGTAPAQRSVTTVCRALPSPLQTSRSAGADERRV